MAYVQFLNGPRSDEYVELHPTASLILGSDPDAHILVTDSGVAGKHCTIYPAQGTYWLTDMGEGDTILNMKRLVSATDSLGPDDIAIVGTTFFRFLSEPPRCPSCGTQQED